MKPVYVGLAGPTILSEENKVISIRASDLLGRPVEVSVQLESLQAKDSETKVDGVQLVQATPSTTDKYDIFCFSNSLGIRIFNRTTN